MQRSSLLLLVLGLAALGLVLALALGGRSTARNVAPSAETAAEAPGPGLGDPDARAGSSAAAAESPGAQRRSVQRAGPPPESTSGTVLFLSDVDSRPIAGAGWSFRGEDGSSVDLRTDPLGRVELAPGAYDLSSTDGAFACAPADRRVRAGEELIVRAVPIGDLTVRVTDPTGAPVRGAWVTVRGSLERYGGASPVVRTDDAGLARIERLPLAERPTLRAWADGYRTASLRCWVDGQGQALVVLVPASELRPLTLRCLDLATDQPLQGVRCSAEGTTLGPTSDAAGLLRLPAIERDAWEVFSGSCYPAAVELPKSDGAEPTIVRLPRPVSGLLRLSGAAGTAIGVRIEVLDPDATPYVSEQLSGLTPLPGTPGDHALDLPQGIEVRLSVRDERGRTCSRTFTAAAADWLLELEPTGAGSLELHVLGDGRPLPDATAKFWCQGGPRAEPVEAGPDGIVRVPWAAETYKILLDAPGFVPLVLQRGDEQAPAHGRMDVDLASSDQTHVLALDGSGAPLAGVQLQASSRISFLSQFPDHRGGRPSSHPAWNLTGFARPSARTDSTGRATLRTGRGLHDIGVEPPASLYGTPYGDSLLGYGIPSIELPAPDELVLRLPTPRRVTITASLATTGELAADFEVWWPGLSRPVPAQGSRFTEVFTDDPWTIGIAHPSGATARLEVPAGSEPLDVEVRLEPSSGMELVVLGDSPPGGLDVHVYGDWGGDWTGRGRQELDLDELGRGSLGLAQFGKLAVLVPGYLPQDPVDPGAPDAPIPYVVGGRVVLVPSD